MNILWLHDNINDHKELDKQLRNFEKPVVSFTDAELCISFLVTSGQQNNNRPSILIVLNRIARRIIPEIHSYTTLLFAIIFCTKNDNKIKWTCKYNKIRDNYVNPNELITCVRQVIKISGLIKPFPCQLVLLNDHPNEIIEGQLHRLDSSLITFNQIHLCLSHLQSNKYDRSLILITVNSLGRQIVPEIHSYDQLKVIYIYNEDNDKKIKWTAKYDKIKLVTASIIDLINDVRNEGLYHSVLPWHLVCLNAHNDEALRDRLYELDPCLTTFDRFEICQKYLNSVNKTTFRTKPILFIAINEMGRQFIPEIHSNDGLSAFYIFVSPDSPNARKIKWTTKYRKIKHVCTDLNQLIEYIKQDAAVLTQNVIQNSQIIDTTSMSLTKTTRRRIIDNHIICWFDPSICEIDEDYQHPITEISKIVNSVVFFNDPDEYVDFLTDTADEKVSLIIPSDFVQHMIPLIHDIPQLYATYIFSNVNASSDQEWIKTYRNIKGIFTETKSICVQLEQDIHESNQDTIPISFVSLPNPSSNVDLDRLNPLFMYSQLLKEILLDLEYTAASIKDFVNYSIEQFTYNNVQLDAIKKLETDYYSQSPVWWYTDESFIYSILNKALRTFDIEVTIKMGFFIRDLHRHIKQLHTDQFSGHNRGTFTVYRGQSLSTADFEEMRRSKGGLISFNSFLSTSLNRSISLRFAERSRYNSDLIGILFNMEINPSISSTPFAAVKDISRWQNEDEILFSMHTVYRIRNIKSVADRLFQVDLTLTGEDDQELQMLTKYIRREIGGDTGFERLGALMFEIGHYDMALELYKTLLSTAQPHQDKQRISSMHNQVGAIYSRKGEFDKALAHYKKSFEIKLTYVSPTDSSLSAIYSNIGSALRNQNQMDEALEYMQRALTSELQAFQSDPLKIASYRNNIGLVLTDQNRYNEALEYYEEALEVQEKYLPANHPNLATSFNNIGIIYNEMQAYNKALSFYEKALDIMQRSLPYNHPNLATPYNNLGSVYSELQEYTKALSYYEKSMEILENSLPSNHSSFALAYHNLALTHYRLGSYKIALQYGEKAVEICHQALESSDPQAIECQETLKTIREKLQKDVFQQ